MCEVVIRAAEAVGSWDVDPHDPVPGSEISLNAISPRLFAHVEDHLFELVWPLLQESWGSIDFTGIHDAFVIRYEAHDRPDLPLHHDVAQISGSLKLNDDFVGGRLEFPRQEVDNGDLGVGELLLWPSLVTHPHRAAPVTSGVKYGLTIWCAIPGAVIGASDSQESVD
jgi:hypothetical protein